MTCSRVTCGLLITLALLWLAGVCGLVALEPALALSPREVWHGQIWRPLSALFLVRGPVDLLVNGFALAWLGGALERFWKPWEWLAYVLLCGCAAAFAASAIFAHASTIPAGPAPLALAALVALARLARGERIHVSPASSVSASVLFLVLAALSLVLPLATGYPLAGLALLVLSALIGWTYLSLRWRWNDRVPARANESRRGRHLEL